MKSRDFVYWLQGFFELAETDTLNERQVDLIKRHLNMVFAHEIDPSMGDEEHQEHLSDLHDALNDAMSDKPRPRRAPSPVFGPYPRDLRLKC